MKLKPHFLIERGSCTMSEQELYRRTHVFYHVLRFYKLLGFIGMKSIVAEKFR
jgi:hypothetical protein